MKQKKRNDRAQTCHYGGQLAPGGKCLDGKTEWEVV